MARDELRLGEIDLNFTQALKPVDARGRPLKASTGLPQVNQDDEANQVMKATEDVLVVEAVSINEMLRPKGENPTATQQLDGRARRLAATAGECAAQGI